jgi:hypothetical protein
MQGLLSSADYRVIVNASRGNGLAQARVFAHCGQPQAERVREKIGNTATIRSANALRDWNQWMRDNPKATDAQADAESQRM